MQQILNKSEGAEPSADKAPYNSSHEDEKARYIEGQFKMPASNDSLQRAYRTGAESARAGIAVQPRNADIFQFSLIETGIEKTGKIAVGSQRPGCLNCMARRFADFFLFVLFTQFRYTPYIN